MATSSHPVRDSGAGWNVSVNLCEPMTLDPVFLDVDRWIADLFAPEDDALQRVHRSMEEAEMPTISVSAVEGKLLHVLARACGARCILEIGTLAGYSTIWMARALPEGGRLISIEHDPEHARVARENVERAGLANAVTVRVGAALEVLPVIEAEGLGPFDMVFIDADKAPYAAYLDWALRLSRPGTLIVADNVVQEGEVLDEASDSRRVKGVQRFNAAIAAESRLSAVILQTVGPKGHDGMAIAVVR